MNNCLLCTTRTQNTEMTLKTPLGMIFSRIGPWCNECLRNGEITVEPRYQPFLELMRIQAQPDAHV